MKRLSLFFIQGLLVLLPFVGTIYILTFIYEKISGIGSAILLPLVGRDLPFIDFAVVIIIVALIGFMANWWISKKFFAFLEEVISRVPGVSNIYTTIRDTLKALAGDQKKFDKVVLVHLTDSIARLGFLTVEEATFKTKDGREMVGVYFPQTMQVAGDMYWVPRDSVEIVDISVDRALKLILSGGAAGTEGNVKKVNPGSI
ncbi:MAG: DUF502 domain-containing protein [Desulfotomaculum sp.]|nr:DUF502 domain-containing protein [Desulfotomaculum sp.]